MELLKLLRRYHSYEAIGLGNIPREGRCLVVGTHSFATYENFLLSSLVEEVIGRKAMITADGLIFRLNFLRPMADRLGLIAGDRKRVIELLKQDHLVAVGPGGMRESLRSSRKRYEIDWNGRYGFVWASILASAPIVLAACPAADRIFTLYENPVTRKAYARLRVPVPLFRGLGPTLLPRPVRLRHVLSRPIPPPCPPEEANERVVAEHHQVLASEMRSLIAEALEN